MAQKRKDWNGLISGFKASDLVFLDESGCNTDMTRRSPGCGSQRLLRCRLHPAGRGPNSSSLFPPQAAVVAVAHFSHFSDLLLRSWCYLSADGKVLLKPEIFGEAVKRRRLKMRLRDLHAEWRESPAF